MIRRRLLASQSPPLYIEAEIVINHLAREPTLRSMSIVLALLLLMVMFLVTAGAIMLVIGPLIILQPSLRTKEWYATFSSLLQPSDAGLPQEDLWVTTRDGLRLSCWLVRQPEAARGTIIYLHGVGDCKISGVSYARFFFRRGFNTFLYDSRRHGNSEGSYCTYGFYERHDLSTVIDYLQSRDELRAGPFGVFGTSMGAAVALQAAALDERIAAIVAEASFTDLRTIMVDYQKRMTKLPWHFLRNAAMTRSQKIAKFKAREVSPLQAVKSVRKPILFIHGTDDSHISTAYSKALYQNANEPKELLLVPRGDHTDLLNVGGGEYVQRITSFFERNLR
jgi:fermentation-respiration switch protein FrsA (DUF1100 family)